MKTKKIGLLGESPNDTQAIANLLNPNYPNFRFQTALRNLKGDDLMTLKGLRMIIDLWVNREYDFLIFVKDLDGFEEDIQKRAPIQKRFEEIQKVYPRKNLLLLNIQELESLILADIKSFDSTLSFTGDPMKIESPKEFLQRELKKAKSAKSYKETDALEIFKRLNINTLQNNCRYFSHFIKELNTK